MEYHKTDSYFLKSYLYEKTKEGKEAILQQVDEGKKEMWGRWRCAILVETERCFFDTVWDTLPDEIRRGTRRQFSYYNLNSWQSLLLFFDENCDYRLVARQLYVFLKRRYTEIIYLSVSDMFEGYENLSDILWQVERQMEEKYYHPDVHVFINDEDYNFRNEEVRDSRLLEIISEDISRKDLEALRKHYGCLTEKYQDASKYSAMYVKFVYSSLIQELFWELEFAKRQNLKDEIDRLYRCGNMKQIIAVTDEAIQKYCDFIEETMDETIRKVMDVKNYILQNYSERLDIGMFAQMVGLAPGYLSFIFKKVTGVSIQRFIRLSRMAKAEELLANADMTPEQVCEELGFANVSYFYKSYYEHYGRYPRESGKDGGKP